MQKLWRIRRNFAIFRRKLDLKLHFGTYFGASAPKILEFKGQNKTLYFVHCTLLTPQGGDDPQIFAQGGDASPSSPMHGTPSRVRERVERPGPFLFWPGAGVYSIVLALGPGPGLRGLVCVAPRPRTGAFCVWHWRPRQGAGAGVGPRSDSCFFEKYFKNVKLLKKVTVFRKNPKSWPGIFFRCRPWATCSPLIYFCEQTKIFVSKFELIKIYVSKFENIDAIKVTTFRNKPVK